MGEVGAEQIQCEFYGAETQGEDTQSNSTISTSGSGGEGHNAKMYRDVLVNIRDSGSGLIYEVQITLTGIAILKKSEQKIYSIVRMASGQELLETFVFSRCAHSDMANLLLFPEHKGAAVEKKRILEKNAEGTEQMLSSATVTPESLSRVSSKSVTFPLDAVTSKSSTPALPDIYGKPIDKPLPGGPIRKAELVADADIQRSFFSCGCEPCSSGVRAVQAESDIGSPFMLAESTMIPFDAEKARTLMESLSQEYLDRVQDPKNGCSVSQAKRELNDLWMKALEDDTTDVETMLGLKGALKIFNEKHPNSNQGPGPTLALCEPLGSTAPSVPSEVNNVLSL